ncbi:hypothetical protein [Candidatus Neptunochlamydia vexilliferae]|nr:hypothetical protein [Candidatus Neptunochlamydia vexilliferae]
MLDKKTQAYYQNIFLDSLDDISNAEKQEKAWVHGNYEGFNTFIEIFEGFISPCESVKKWSTLSAKQRQDLERFYDLLINYDDTKKVGEQTIMKSDKEICQDPAWGEIRKFGRRLYEELKKNPLM